MESPWAIVVAGVSGSGKSTIGRRLAADSGAVFAEGDDFHSEASVAKMRSGRPLEDHDRAPWLASVAGWIDRQHEAGSDVVVSCSALTRGYRDVLATGRPWVRFCLLDVPVEVLRARVSGRTGHFMPASLLGSQLALLESLEADENGVTVEASGSPDEVVAVAGERLGVKP